jgi:hypothetical protein
MEQIGPLLPDGTQNPRGAGGNEYTGTTGCISVPASAVPATTMTPLFVRAVVLIGIGVAVALVGYAIGRYAL